MPPTRRQFLQSTGAAGLATLAAQAGRSLAQTAAAANPRTVQTDVLDIGYEEHGNPTGTAIILLHGFPYDVRSFEVQTIKKKAGK